jgi:hypothetical protein
LGYIHPQLRLAPALSLEKTTRDQHDAKNRHGNTNDGADDSHAQRNADNQQGDTQDYAQDAAGMLTPGCSFWNRKWRCGSRTLPRKTSDMVYSVFHILLRTYR